MRQQQPSGMAAHADRAAFGAMMPSSHEHQQHEQQRGGEHDPAEQIRNQSPLRPARGFQSPVQPVRGGPPAPKRLTMTRKPGRMQMMPQPLRQRERHRSPPASRETRRLRQHRPKTAAAAAHQPQCSGCACSKATRRHSAAAVRANTTVAGVSVTAARLKAGSTFRSPPPSPRSCASNKPTHQPPHGQRGQPARATAQRNALRTRHHRRRQHAQPHQQRHQRCPFRNPPMPVHHAKNRQRLVRREFQRRQQRPAPEREQAQGGKEKALALHGGCAH
jgi:hypothetical protein